jgi:hypothetical protein
LSRNSGRGWAEPKSYAEQVADVSSLRRALLELHGELLQAQRMESERFGGRMSAGETLQAAVDDLRFSWIRTVSALISELDEAVGTNNPEGQAAVERAVRQARGLFVPPDPDTAFGARYLRALQDHPGVILAHRDVVAALQVESPTG